MAGHKFAQHALEVGRLFLAKVSPQFETPANLGLGEEDWRNWYKLICIGAFARARHRFQILDDLCRDRAENYEEGLAVGRSIYEMLLSALYLAGDPEPRTEAFRLKAISVEYEFYKKALDRHEGTPYGHELRASAAFKHLESESLKQESLKQARESKEDKKGGAAVPSWPTFRTQAEKVDSEAGGSELTDLYDTFYKMASSAAHGVAHCAVVSSTLAQADGTMRIRVLCPEWIERLSRQFLAVVWCLVNLVSCLAHEFGLDVAEPVKRASAALTSL